MYNFISDLLKEFNLLKPIIEAFSDLDMINSQSGYLRNALQGMNQSYFCI